MKKFYPVLILVISILLIFGTSKQTAEATVYKSFGGRVLLAPIPGVTCLGLGKLLVLNTNIGALIGAATSATSKDSEATAKTISTLMNLYNMIPTYATNPLKSPNIGGQILGSEKPIPSLKTCFIGSVPIPVFLTTANYGVSVK